MGCEPGLSTCAQTKTRANVNKRPRPLAHRTGKGKKKIRESEKETKRKREKKRGKGEGETEERKREEWPAFRFFSLKIRSPALRTMAFDVVKLESMLRDALDEVSGLETMLVTARARVRRNETPFSFKAFSSPKFLFEHPFPQVAVLKHHLRHVAVQEVAEEIGGAAEVEDVLAELESESHRGAAPAKPQSSRPFVPTPTPVARPVASVAKPLPPMPVASPGGCQPGASSQTRACPRGHRLRGVLELEPWMHGGQSARVDVLPVEVSTTPARTRSAEVTGDAQGRCQGD